MLIEKESQVYTQFNNYKRNIHHPKDNSQELNLMALDFKAEVEEKSKNPCKSVLFINSIDEKQNIYLIKVIGFRMFIYAEIPSTLDQSKITPEYLISLTNYLNNLIMINNLIDKIQVAWKECFLNYKGEGDKKQPFFKIYINDHTLGKRVAD